jgi:hypothetical protein
MILVGSACLMIALTMLLRGPVDQISKRFAGTNERKQPAEHRLDAGSDLS